MNGRKRVEKSLDAKLARIAADSSCGDFILADAKDADMAYGIAAPGISHLAPGESPGAKGAKSNNVPCIGRYRSIQQYRDHIREIVEQRLVDIMLMSVSTSGVLTVRERLFDNSPVTPAIRANDTTDIWLASTQAAYSSQPSLPFRTALLEEATEVDPIRALQHGELPVDLGLYSITLNNVAELDSATLAAYREFRKESWRSSFRHFLEVFPPNAPGSNAPADVPRFVNDSIVRLLAGVGARTRPRFLKIPYFGPAALEELVAYDSSLVVGILGGSAGTTFDAFQMLWEAKKHGARAALFGRKINNAEHQPSFVAQLRALADGDTKPAEAVRAYHAALEKLHIKPNRALEEDLQPAQR